MPMYDRANITPESGRAEGYAKGSICRFRPRKGSFARIDRWQRNSGSRGSIDLLKAQRLVPNEPGWALKEYGVACVFRKSEG